MNDKTIEQEIQSKGLTAPRITQDDIEANIVEEHYFCGDSGLEALRLQWLTEDHSDHNERKAARDLLERIGVMSASAARRDIDIAMGRDGNGWNQQALGLLTFCVLVLKNGFTVTGESACASPENFDAEIGRKVARLNAVSKIWLLMGYALKQDLFERRDVGTYAGM